MNTSKVGRKQRHQIDTKTGAPVVGLTRRPDGRWRVIGTHKTFREADEQKAIDKFRKLTAAPETEEQLNRRMMPQHERAMFITWMAVQIRSRPQWAAAQLGIEQIAYLADLQPPEVLPTFKELEELWMSRAKCSAEQRKKILRGWQHFVAHSRINGLRDMTATAVIEYQDTVHESDASGKQQSHLFGSIRRVLSFAKQRGLAVEAISKALEYAKILKPSESGTSIDPKPIDPTDWNELLKAAKGEDRAMLLLMLNGAFYLKEAISLKWGAIKREGVIITHRKKKGQCVRICVLWKETLDALASMERGGDDEVLFKTYRGEPIKICGAQRRFVSLTKRANVDVTASQLRDGAFTAAASANVSANLCNVLVGHRSGMTDNYVKRDPKMVAPACEAVYNRYMKTT